MGAYFERKMEELLLMHFFTKTGRLGLVLIVKTTRTKRYLHEINPPIFEEGACEYKPPRAKIAVESSMELFLHYTAAHILRRIVP